MSLLVTFFVLLLSFANMDIVKFKKAMGSMKDALGVERQHVGDFNTKSTSPIELSDRQTTPFIDLIDMPTTTPILPRPGSMADCTGSRSSPRCGPRSMPRRCRPAMTRRRATRSS